MVGWTESTVGNVCEVIAGQSPKGTNYNDDGDGLPFYQGKKEFGDKYIGVPAKWTTQITREARAGDILMSVRAPVGPINFATERICIGRGLAAIRAGEQINRDFLFYALLAMKNQIQGNEGAVFASINKKQIASLPFCYPPLSEQKRIVAILDEAFAAIATATASAEKNLANARELFESHLFRVSEESQSWPHRLLIEVATDFNRGRSRHRPRNAPHLYGGTYPFIQTGDIRHSNHWIIDHSQTYSEAGLKQSKMWPAGTVCITIAANIAESGILTFDACFPDSVIGVVVDEHQISNQYLEYIFQANKARLQAEGQGAAQDNINLGTFQGQRFPVPPLKEQERYVDLLDRVGDGVEKLETVLAAKAALLTELKQSILHKAFIGELTADPNTADSTLKEAGV